MAIWLEIIGMVLLVVLLIPLVTYAIYQAPRRHIGYIPLPPRGVEAVVEALGITAGSATVVVDLGCGDGRVLKAVLEPYPHARGVGVELNPPVLLLARWRLRRLGRRVRLVRGDVLNLPLRKATHVFTYLNHPTMATLEAKFDQELPPGSRLVSCDFPLPRKRPARTITIGETWQLGQKLYIYEF